jgi:hypothetical protein
MSHPAPFFYRAARDCLENEGKLYLNYPKKRARLISSKGHARSVPWKHALAMRGPLERSGYATQIVVTRVAGRHLASEEPHALTTKEVLARWPELRDYYSAPQQELARAVKDGRLNGIMFGKGMIGAIDLDERFRTWLAGRGIDYESQKQAP